MKISATISFILLFGSLFWYGCSKETVEPELFGNVEGQVQDSDTGNGIAGVSISTNPGTDAILTGENGQFTISEIPTGNYTVQAEKDGYTSKTVRVAVKQDQKATAQILLKSENSKPTRQFIHAEVTSYANTSRNDSSFAEVSYLVSNDSDNQLVRKFEVYFKIYTHQTVYYSEIKGDTLDSGQRNIGEFVKYIRQTSADSVAVSGVYAPDSQP